MSENETVQETGHAMLVVWGQYAHCLGIPQEFAQVPMSQKTVEHSPRFAAHWLAEQCPQVPDGWKASQSPNVKEQVKVGAHSPAYVQWFGCLVRFKERSVYVGRSFFVRRQIAIQLTLRI
jgi:hypothetical protein